MDGAYKILDRRVDLPSGTTIFYVEVEGEARRLSVAILRGTLDDRHIEHIAIDRIERAIRLAPWTDDPY